MCGRINQEQYLRKDQLLEKIAAELRELDKVTNIGIGDKAVVEVMTGSGKPEQEIIKFGFNAGGRLNFNARAEGFHNKENLHHYEGNLGIATNPFYQKLVDTSRCAIPVTSFLEGPEKEKLSKPFDIGLGGNVFWLGGLIGIDEKTGLKGFSIITTWPNLTIKEVVGHHRSPLIITDKKNLADWLDQERNFVDVSGIIRNQIASELVIKELDPRYKSAKYTEPINY